MTRLLVRDWFMRVRTLEASTLPSSTPHWSNELMPQMKPCGRGSGLQIRVHSALEKDMIYYETVYRSVTTCTAHLYCHAVLVHGQQLSDRVGRAAGHHDGQRGPVASEGLVGNEVVRDVLRTQLLGGLAVGQGIGLREETTPRGFSKSTQTGFIPGAR